MNVVQLTPEKLAKERMDAICECLKFCSDEDLLVVAASNAQIAGEQKTRRISGEFGTVNVNHPTIIEQTASFTAAQAHEFRMSRSDDAMRDSTLPCMRADMNG